MDNISEFNDTQRLLWENEELQRLTRSAVMCTRVFPEKFETTRVMGCVQTVISVTDESALSAARRLTGARQKVAVLNFANAVNPGGAVLYGGDGREERLCRCTNLYPCLTKPEIFADFYDYNNQMDCYYSDRIIYTENVTVFKTDLPVCASTKNWFMADVISCPAPNLNGVDKMDERRLERLLAGRIQNILAVAEAHAVSCLVLGDFGCGAFMNPPELVARAFEEQLNRGMYKNTFREIVFAIPCDGPAAWRVNETFKAVLCPWQKNPLYGKRVSILGDSLSTYWGSNPRGFKVFYEGERCLSCGIYTVEDTWWQKVLRYFGGSLLVNNSCADTTACGDSRYCGNSDFRILGLHEGNLWPEVVLVCMGTWDFLYGMPIEDESLTLTWENYYGYFRSAYETMLWKLKKTYPAAEIYCATIVPPLVLNKNVSLTVQNIYGVRLEDYNHVIRSCAQQYGCQVADVSKYVRGYETSDQFHANAAGMDTLASGWVQELEALNEYKYRVDGCPAAGSRRVNRRLTVAALLCLLLCLGFFAVLASVMRFGWIENTFAAGLIGILPGVFMGMSILFFWFGKNPD